MAYEVIARKWRPQQFGDVVGQQHVTQTLTNAIESERVAHAYLFVGPRGVGKTSTARIFAKALNCEKGPTATPCDKCDSCREVMSGSSLDVLEIDAASNTGVDNVRDLRQNVMYAPARGPFKIYIIDEVHMLSNAAFNALLKTLEEPPAHVKFLFATTEPQELPATILSRCQRFDLRRISTKDIVERLAEIAKAEKIAVDDDALLAIARGAEGGLRDAESALDQLIAFRGKTIREEDVLAVFGLVARHSLEELAQAILKGDVPRAIKIVAELDENGKDVQRLVVELLEHFRNILVCQYVGPSFAGTDLTESQVQTIQAQSALAASGRVLRVVDILTETENRMKYALSRRTLLETALIRAGRASTVVSLDEILARLERLQSGGAIPAGEPPAARELPTASARPAAKPVTYTASGAAPAPQAVHEKEGSKDPLKMLSERWHELVERIGHAAALARSYLIDAKPVKIDGNHVTIGFDPEFADNKDKIDFPRNVKVIQKALGEILKQDVTVEFCVLDGKSTLPGDIKVGKPTETQAGETHSDPQVKAVKAKTRQEWIQNPTVRKTLEMFNGDITDVRE